MAEVTENTPLDADTALSLGKRHLLVRDYISAVNTLVQACELLAKVHGDGADELAEPYLLYGRALLGLAREESNVLGAAIPGEKESDDEAEEAEDDEEGDDEETDDKSEKEEKDEVTDKKENSEVTEKEEKNKVADKEEKSKVDKSNDKIEVDVEDNKNKVAESKDKMEIAVEEKKNEVVEKEKKNEVAEKAADTSKEADASSEKKESETKQSEGQNKVEGQKAEKSKMETETASEESALKVEDKSVKMKPAESKEENKTETSKTDDEKETEKNEKSQVPKDEAIPGSSNMTNGESSAENGSTAENGEDDDDIDNLEVAWEVLELAKLMLRKRGPPGWKLLSEAHKLLGEVAMEGGNAIGAITDFQSCLELLQKIEPCDPRAIAEIYYQLGLTNSFLNDFDTSIEKYQEASSILEARIKELEQITDAPKSEDPFYSVEGEINELKQLLPEIGEKISDMKDAKQQAYKRIVEDIRERTAAGGCSNGASTSSVNGGATTSGSSSGSSSKSSSGPPKKSVNDISHLIRKKRKPEEAVAEESSPCKKPSPQ